MEPVTIIVNALVLGVANSLQPAAEQAVSDLYVALRNTLTQRYSVGADLDLFESHSQDADIQERMRSVFLNLKVGDDQEVIKLAAKITQYFGPVLSPEELLEKAQRDAGYQALEMRLDDHVETVLGLHQRFSVKNDDLVSSRLAVNKQLSLELRKKTGALGVSMRAVIEAVAQNIENNKYSSFEGTLAEMQLPAHQREWAKQIVSADKRVHVSCQTLKLTVEYFTQLNEAILQKIEAASQQASAQAETKLVLGNALLVYELTDYVIDYIEHFKIVGIDAIRKLHSDALRMIGEMRQDAESLREQVRNPKVSAEVAQQTLANIKDREDSIMVIEQEWQAYLTSIKELENETGAVGERLHDLRVIREDARQQLKLLQAVMMLQILQNNLGALKAAMLTVGQIRLAPLSPDRVRRLLGFSKV